MRRAVKLKQAHAAGRAGIDGTVPVALAKLVLVAPQRCVPVIRGYAAIVYGREPDLGHVSWVKLITHAFFVVNAALKKIYIKSLAASSSSSPVALKKNCMSSSCLVSVFEAAAAPLLADVHPPLATLPTEAAA